MDKNYVYGELPESHAAPKPKGSDIQAIVETPKEKTSLDELLAVLAKYAQNFEGQAQSNYMMAKLLARTTKNKRDHLHYFIIFNNMYMNNLFTQLGEDKAVMLSEFKTKLNDLQKELANILKDVKVDDTGMMPYLVGITEGLL